jgi:hypothetical protein
LAWHDAIHSFWSANSNEDWLQIEPTGNCSFSARVRFWSDVRSTAVLSRVTLVRNGYEDGAVLIDEADDLKAYEYHTKFLPIRGCTCRYVKQTNALVVSGRSPKMGTYSVTITPEG